MISTNNRLINLLNQLNSTLAPLNTTLAPFAGNSGFNAFLNCKFVAIDLNNFLNVFGGNFSSASLGLGILLILGSFFNAIVIIFTIFTINFGRLVEGAQVVTSEVQMVPGAQK